VKPYHKNPRRLTDKQYSDLQSWLRELGDLSGIVHDLNSDEIIGGNMRGRVFDINACQVEIVHRQEQPDAQGTVAHGFIVWEGNRYAYREVRWTPKQCEKANIVANKAGGDFDFDCLANNFEMDDLIEWGFDEAELVGSGDSDAITPDVARATLAERFIVPPFSVLDARQGYWQDRKRAWIALGIQSELGRGGGNACPPHGPCVTQNPDGTLHDEPAQGRARRQPAPGGSPRPACDYSKRQRGDGHGRPIA
jgi:hypothetical protein